MKKLIIKVLLTIMLAMIVFLGEILILNYKNISKHGLKYMPYNNASNSPCFRAKLDHLIVADNFKNTTFLIAGTSIALNNLSGELVQRKSGECVYNISSWSFKPRYVNQLFQVMDLEKVKYVLVAFNNVDFVSGSEVDKGVGYEIDLKSAKIHIYGNKISRFENFLEKFNLKTFTNDWNERTRYSSVNNVPESMNFDQYGSVILTKKNFMIDEFHKTFGYRDTTGFSVFLNDLKLLETTCRSKNVSLFLVYFPIRPSSLSETKNEQNDAVSAKLKSAFKNSYIDMHKFNVGNENYYDDFHMFSEGALLITNSVMDSLCNSSRIHRKK